MVNHQQQQQQKKVHVFKSVYSFLLQRLLWLVMLVSEVFRVIFSTISAMQLIGVCVCVWLLRAFLDGYYWWLLCQVAHIVCSNS